MERWKGRGLTMLVPVLSDLDPRSLASATTLTGLSLCAVIWMMHRGARQLRGTLSWVSACASVSVGLWILANSLSVSRFVLVVVANVLLNTAPSLIWHGVRAFGDKAAPRMPVLATALFTVAWSWWFGMQAPNHLARVVVFSLLIAGWSLAAGWEFLRLPQRREGPGVALSGTPLLLFSVVMLARAGQALAMGVESVSTRAVPANPLIYLAGSVALLSSMIGIVLCISTRLTSDARRMAYEDSLTGALSRRGLYDALPVWQSRYGRGASVTLIDLDYFKSVNDTLGHAAGDELLRVLVRSLQAHVPDDGLLARTGGDEFVLLLSARHAPEPIVRASTADFLTASAVALDLSDIYPRPGVSMGTAMLDGVDVDAFDQALGVADDALYERKNDRFTLDSGEFMRPVDSGRSAAAYASRRQQRKTPRHGSLALDD
jgi:diguanylate cyclase (GGDEF)-like protein